MLLLLWGLLAGPVFGFEEAVLLLSGASCVEDLSEDEMSRWEALAEHPVNLNVAGRSRLMASGLLTQFQVISLLDYRRRTGAVLSWSELALVDGFSPGIVAALKVFARLGVEDADGGSGRFIPGRRESLQPTGSLTLRGTTRATIPYSAFADASWSGAGGLKLEAMAGERAALFLSVRNTLSDARFGSPTFSAAYYGHRALEQVVVGHFQARFGQGLVLWSGFRMSGYSSVGAFRRNGNGFAPTGSYSPKLLGVATDWHFGRWRLSAGYSVGSSWKDFGALRSGAGGGQSGLFGGTLPILNLTRTARTSTLGLTATSEAAGFEARWSLPGGWSLFGEVATGWKELADSGSGNPEVSAFGNWLRTLSSVAGAVWVPSYGHKWALLGRWSGPSSKEYSGLALGYAGPSLETTLDAGHRLSDGQTQIKFVTQWKPEFEWFGVGFHSQLRGVGRWRQDGLRLELRGVLTAEYGPWTLSGRYDAVWYRGFAWNWYAEAGFRTDALKVWLRGGIFKVDDWDDRIYVYERDASGSFNVPARYGRGWDASLNAAWDLGRHFSLRHSLWFRLETVQYPWALSPKSGRLEARLQYRLKW